MTTPPQHLSFFALPGEIRNKIYLYALTPSDIWLHSPPQSENAASQPFDHICIWIAFLFDIFVACVNTIAKIPPLRSLGWPKIHDRRKLGEQRSYAAYDFLTTCRRVRDEGAAVFYAQNRFHLPSGTVEDMQRWMRALRPGDRALLDVVFLGFSFLDLESRDVETLYVKAIVKSFFSFGRSMQEIWVADMESVLFEIWTRKAEVLERWGHAEELERWGDGEDGKVVRQILLEMRRKVGRSMWWLITRKGVRGTKEWLGERRWSSFGRGIRYRVRL